MSNSKLRELLLNGHLTYKEYTAEVARLDTMRERLYTLYINGQITHDVLQVLLADLDRKEDFPEPPTIY